MRILAAATAFCLATLAPVHGAWAEDFSGFYAGVNAGYGFGKDRSERDIGPAAIPAPAATDTTLPPSAASAARTMQGSKAPAAKGR